jgi:hypothetical protein
MEATTIIRRISIMELKQEILSSVAVSSEYLEYFFSIYHMTVTSESYYLHWTMRDFLVFN